jgi:glycosyl transferase, family 25
MHAYVVNLARSADRRSSIMAGLERVGQDYEIFTAVDGQALDFSDPDVSNQLLPGFLDKFRPGEAGCALSHINVYRKILADGLDRALVLEDDVIPLPELPDIAEAAAGCLEGAEVALLCFDSSENEVVRLSRRDAIDLPAGRQLVSPLEVGQLLSTAGYVITRKACERMIKLAVPIQTKADDWALFRQIGALDRVRCVVPLGVHKDPGFGSTIGYNANTSLKARVLALISHYDPGLVKGVVAHRRQRIHRRHTRVEFVDG